MKFWNLVVRSLNSVKHVHAKGICFEELLVRTCDRLTQNGLISSVHLHISLNTPCLSPKISGNQDVLQEMFKMWRMGNLWLGYYYQSLFLLIQTLVSRKKGLLWDFSHGAWFSSEAWSWTASYQVKNVSLKCIWYPKRATCTSTCKLHNGSPQCDVTRDDFSATQRSNIVVTLFRMAAISFQHFNPCESFRVTSPLSNDDNDKLVLV